MRAREVLALNVKSKRKAAGYKSSRASVTRKFREIAMISVDDQGWERADSHVVGKMLEQARQIGADALVLTDRETNSSGGAVVGNVWMSGNNKVMRGIAIVYEN